MAARIVTDPANDGNSHTSATNGTPGNATGGFSERPAARKAH